MGKMKIVKNGIMCDPDNDFPLCGTVTSEGELTLFKTKEGEFYTLVTETGDCDEVIGHEVELNTKSEAAQIMYEMGFNSETIKQETGFKILGEIETGSKKKCNHSHHQALSS